MGLYIEQLANGSWGGVKESAEYDLLTTEQLKEMGWYKFVPGDPQFIDMDMSCTVENVLENDVVYRRWTCTRKTGEELQEAIKMKWIAVRLHRNAALQSCDYTQLNDAPLTQEAKNAWAAYRQLLRDVTSTAGDPFDLIWPIDPNGNSSEPRP